MCRECPVGGTGTLKQSLGPAARVFTDANRHRDHGLPPVPVVGVFVLVPPPLLSVVPGPVPGFLSCSGGCTNAISHLLADSEYCTRGRSLQEKRVESGHRPKYRSPLPSRPLQKGAVPRTAHLTAYCYWAVGLVHCWRTWLLVPDAMIMCVFFYVAFPVVVFPVCSVKKVSSPL